MMNVEAAKPVVVDLDADIEVVANDARMATPARSGRLAHTLPRFASGSGAIDPMPTPTSGPADGVPEPLEDTPTTASRITPAARELPLVAPPEPEPIATEIAAPQVVAPLPVPVIVPARRVTALGIAFVAFVIAAWCLALAV